MYHLVLAALLENLTFVTADVERVVVLYSLVGMTVIVRLQYF